VLTFVWAADADRIATRLTLNNVVSNADHVLATLRAYFFVPSISALHQEFSA